MASNDSLRTPPEPAPLEAERAATLVAARYRDLLEHLPDAMVIVNTSGRIVLVNAQAERVFGHSREEMLNQPIEMLLPQRHRANHAGLRDGYIAQPRTRGMGASQRLTGLRKGSAEFPVEISLSPLKTEEGLLIMSAVRDVTDRRQVEQTLQSALHEREILLKEVHHRVKNNMQVISSLLQLQADQLDDGATRGVFEDCQNRIKSMSLIHEKLYKTSDFSQVDFADYAHSLLAMLGSSLGERAARGRVQLRAEPVRLHIDRAIPAGLILNELVSDCFKHAFPQQRVGTITIDIGASGETGMLLRVGDDGIGIPDGADVGTGPSLGLRLVHILAGQLGASLQFQRERGLCVELTFERFALTQESQRHAARSHSDR